MRSSRCSSNSGTDKVTRALVDVTDAGRRNKMMPEFLGGKVKEIVLIGRFRSKELDQAGASAALLPPATRDYKTAAQRCCGENTCEAFRLDLTMRTEKMADFEARLDLPKREPPMFFLCAGFVLAFLLAGVEPLHADVTAQIRELIPPASAMSQADFHKLATSATAPTADTTEEKSLTLILFTLTPRMHRRHSRLSSAMLARKPQSRLQSPARSTALHFVSEAFRFSIHR